ncbi:MAG: hypothetical protein A3G80_11850 [Betaproteobacteria bacterium RIFCSPLOWO2_12_FULL_62_13b]|nr:MAG: hypothetical protein A3G80_11850 [Betaproteobacteria bacterium RIFCSPLOWO2_12_FULL_62_13b]
MTGMKLTPDDHAWLKVYRHALLTRDPGMIVRLAIHGSKSRGDAHDDSDLDVILTRRARATLSLVLNAFRHQR